MRNQKYYLCLNDFEKRFVLKSLLELRNKLLKNGKYTDGVDDVILKFSRAKKRKFSVK